MAYQTKNNFVVASKVEATYNTAPGATGGTQMRFNDGSPGMKLVRPTIESQETRPDGLSSMGRLGSRSAPGSFNAELSLGSFDMWLEAAMRSTWVAAVAITVDGGAALTSFEVLSTSTFQFAGTTTPVAAGLRVGDVARFTNMSNPANNNLNLRIKAIAGSVVTVYGTPLTVQSADTAATLTILKKLKNAATPTRRTFYVQQHRADADVTQVFGGTRIIGFKLVGTPDGMAMITFTVLGASMAILEGGSAPYYTSPTQYVTIPLIWADATIGYNGSDLATATAFEMDYTINAKTEGVIGTTVSPDVFDNRARLTGSLSLLSQDGSSLTQFLAETEVEFHVLLIEPDAADPKDAMSFFIPRLKKTDVDGALGGDGGFIEQIPFITGKKESATGYDDTLLTICSSAA